MSSVSLPSDKLADIQQLALFLIHIQPVTVCWVMPFLGKANFCANGCSKLQRLCCVIQSDMLIVYHSPSHLFSPVHFSFSALCQLEQLSHLQKSPVSLQFPLPDVAVATDAMPTYWTFYFQGSGLPLSVSGSWCGSMCRAHIALQEFQAITMMLHRMAFCLTGKVVALHLDNNTAKAYLCNQGGTVSSFLSSQACWILSLTDKHSISLIPAYIPTHLNVEADLLSWGSVASRVTSSPSDGSSRLSPLGAMRGGSAGILPYHSMLALLHLGNTTTSECLGDEFLQPCLDISGRLCVSCSCISSSSSVQVPGRICQR